MRIFKTKWFHKWSRKVGLTDAALRASVAEMEKGLIDAELGGDVYKKRIRAKGKGKSGGVRALIAYICHEKSFYIYGFAKNAKENISNKELKALQKLAYELNSYGDSSINKALKSGELLEVRNE